MHLKQLNLTNFKNIAEVELTFSEKINCFLGNNGMGKSNLLDAVYMLSFTKSFTAMTDAQVIKKGEEFATARAIYERHGEDEELTMGLVRGRRKSLKRSGKEYKRLSEHIGVYPLVMAAPHDIDLIRQSGEERRRWIDMVISQSDTRYLQALMRYNAALEQRNRMLRDGLTDATLFLAVDTTLDMAARYIDATRRARVAELSELSQRYYTAIAGEGAEEVAMKFCGSLAESSDGSLMTLLEHSRRRDEAVRHTTVGPHRDDIEMTIEGMPMRRAGSQGQCKTFTTALRLAQYDFLRHTTGMRPILLLDDIFDKLDARRVERIMKLVGSADFGQIFITDTNRDHLLDIIGHTEGSHRLWRVEDGSFTPIEEP